MPLKSHFRAAGRTEPRYRMGMATSIVLVMKWEPRVVAIPGVACF